ncbi:hypothetical protein GOP47_0023801 [Adiantum capillus-veneris]|uniref:Methyltransferase-like protein 5 n=1 Tax=Adiantum capillus-veneris TaxID=13818 RepID=A0A9D4U470_ADICA|nr:hypothetical protein GOP47_0023801 [Adiantum capillus-veneris]
MKLKQLEASISQLIQFQNPKIELEQYSTGAHIASRMLYMANSSYNDIGGKVVVDLGCGCGTLGVAASLLSADHVIGIDIDAEALDVARVNSEEFEGTIDFIQGNVADCKLKGWKVDTVVMNPPFGTRKKGADMMFLSSACQVLKLFPVGQQSSLSKIKLLYEKDSKIGRSFVSSCNSVHISIMLLRLYQTLSTHREGKFATIVWQLLGLTFYYDAMQTCVQYLSTEIICTYC